MRNVVPIYATQADAMAVAAGQFGAVPIAMPGENDIALVEPGPCMDTVVVVRSRAGRQGWAPSGSLPARLLKSSRCTSATNPSRAPKSQ